MNTVTRNIAMLALASAVGWTAFGGESNTVTLDFGDVLLAPDASVTVTIDAQVNDPVRPGTDSVSASATLDTFLGEVASNTVETPIGPDIEPPEITLNGPAELTVECSNGFSDPGATAEDDRDGDLTGGIAVTGVVDTSLPGEYALTYAVQDTAGNVTERTRVVTVVDTTPPTLRFVPGTDFEVCRSSGSFVPEVVATDACAALVTTTVEGVVDLGVAGVYPITATANDGFGETVLTRNFSVITTGGCPTICEITEVDLLNTAQTYAFPERDGAATVRFEARVDRMPEALCAAAGLDVWFDIDGDVFEAEPIEDRYFADLQIEPGAYSGVARASLGEGFPIVSSEELVFEVTAVRSTGSAGLPSQPQGALAAPGDRWSVEDEVPGCLRSAGGVHLTAANLESTPPLTIPLIEPFAGTAEITWPAGLVDEGESLWLFASASCTPDAVLSPADGTLLESTLPVTLDDGWPVIVVHALLQDAEGNLSLVEAAARLADNPLTVRIFGFGTSGSGRTVQGYGIGWTGDSGSVSLSPGAGAWSEAAASGVSGSADGIVFDVLEPGAFAIFETPEMADLVVSPGGPSRVLGVLTVGEPFTVSFTLSNVGGSPLTGTATVDDATGDAQVTSGLAYTLQPAEQTTVVVTVTPSAARTEYEAILTLTGDPDGPRTIALRAAVSEPEKEMQFLGCGARPGGASGAWNSMALGMLLAVAAAADARLRSRAR